MDFTPQALAQRALFIIPTLLSLSVHEWAHAFSAWKLGDDTAAREGRLTLNPIVHIDPIGTILLPLMGVPFGWAKPVPVNPARFDRKWSMRGGMALTAAAGPFSNLVLALLCAVALGIGLRVSPELTRQEGVFMLLLYGIQLNVGLAVFNMLPLPPLDGSRIVARYIPARYEQTWEGLVRFSPLFLFAIIAGGARFLSGPISMISGALFGLIRTIAGG